MKRKSMFVAIVVLAIGFIGLAGGFTKDGTRSVTTCVDPDDPLGILSENPSRKYLGDELCYAHEVKSEMEVKSEVFDPRSTAMFVIAGLIIAIAIRLRKV